MDSIRPLRYRNTNRMTSTRLHSQTINSLHDEQCLGPFRRMNTSIPISQTRRLIISLGEPLLATAHTLISSPELRSRTLPLFVSIEVQLRWVRVRSTSLLAVGLEKKQSCGAAYQNKSHDAYPNAYLLVFSEIMRPGRLGWLSS